MKSFLIRISAAAVLFGAIALGAAGAAAAGTGSFVFDYAHGPAIKVWTYAPEAISPETRVVFVMHGVRRNGEDYRDQWAALAEERGFLLIVPEFSRDDFPGAERYNLGGVFDADGAVALEESWSYSYIEPLFDEVRARYGLKAARYAIYGHSAGAQFVHRFALYKPGARTSAVVSANAGWYEMPDFAAAYPYGLKGAAVEEAHALAYLEKPVVVLLGDADTDPDHPSLRRTSEADAQGLSRFARGQAFFAAGKALAESMGARFNWSLATAPGVDHDNARMAPYAVDYLLAD
ncbi:MAG: alpha/beta hydrolase [Pseudomonadota bacterium]|nr:alpha/beta hydrolase [Pseudomonadota bacterium]